MYLRPRYVVAAACLLLAMAWWRLRPEPFAVPEPCIDTPATAAAEPGRPMPAPAATPGPAERNPTAAEPAPGPVVPPEASAPAPLRLQARIAVQYGRKADDLTAFVGICRVAPEDEAEFMDAPPGATGPDDYFDLASVTAWLPLPIAGDGLMGPIAVPDADAYVVVATRADGTLHHTVYVPVGSRPHHGDHDAGRLRRIPPTGLVITSEGAPTPGRRLYLQRTADAEPVPGDPLPGLLARLFPDTAALYDGMPLELDTETRVAPLYADASIQLILEEADGTRLPLPAQTLHREQMTRVVLPAPPADTQHAGPLDLHGRLVHADGRPLPDGLRLARTDRLPSGVPVAADGSFWVTGVSRVAPTQLRITVPPEAEGRPRLPAQHYLDFHPEGHSGPVANVVWTLPGYTWLEMPLTEAGYTRAARSASPGYPVFVLREETADGFRTKATDHFLMEHDRLAVSVDTPGVYQLVVALSPVYLLECPPVTVHAGENRVTVPLPAALGTAPVYTAVLPDPEEAPAVPHDVGDDGDADTGPAWARVWLMAASPGFPAVELVPDAAGNLRLGPVTVPAFVLSDGTREQHVAVGEVRGTVISLRP